LRINPDRLPEVELDKFLSRADDLLKRLEAHGVNINVQSAQPSGWFQLLGSLLPIVLLRRTAALLVLG